MPFKTLNKLASQVMYASKLPTTSATRKNDRITLPKAVAKQNNRGSIASVQKAGRASERMRKRAAEEAGEGVGGEEELGEGSQPTTRASKRARVTRSSGRGKK
jgi:hypothetical protein